MVCLGVYLLKDIWNVSVFLTITNEAAINMYIQVLCKHKFSLLWDECLGIQWVVDIIVQGLHF